MRGEVLLRFERPVTDPVIAEVGYPALSGYVEAFWLPVLGPTQILLLRRLARDFGRDDVTEVQMLASTMAALLGLGTASASLHRALDRLRRFHLAEQVSLRTDDDHQVQGWRVQTMLPPLSLRQLERLPEAFRRAAEVAHTIHLEGVRAARRAIA